MDEQIAFWIPPISVSVDRQTAGSSLHLNCSNFPTSGIHFPCVVLHMVALLLHTQKLPVQTLGILSDICFNIFLPALSGSPKWSLSLRFPHQNTMHTSPLPTHATCPAHLMLLDFTTHTVLGTEYRSLISSLRHFLHSPVNSSLLGQILSSTPYPQTTSAYVPPSM
jgi:hypothetical protein